MQEPTCDMNAVSAPSDFEDITFDLLEQLQNITYIEKCFRFLAFFGGIPLKCTIVLLLIYSHQFHYPRPIFWPAIAFLKFALLFQCILELVIIINRDHWVSRTLVFIAPVFYFSVLLVLTLIAINRYLDIIHCERYKQGLLDVAFKKLRALIHLIK